MNNKFKSLLFLVFTLLLVTATTYAQDRTVDSLSTNSVEMRGDGAEGEIELDEIVNEKDAEEEVTERGYYHDIYFQNHTGWHVRTYVNGYYQGTMPPYGYMYIPVSGSGTYRLYAEARFTDGSKIYWGGVNKYVNGKFTWNLYR